MSDTEILRLADQHARNANEDIKNAATRVEHMRLTQLAEEADQIAELLRARLSD